MYSSNELMFPPRVIPSLRGIRGPDWQGLVDQVTALPEDDPESLAFVLMMIRLDGCLECETDSYRAMRGCELCAVQSLRRFKGSDRDLLQRHKGALQDVVAFLSADYAGQCKQAA
jgi:hypothetical protein